MDDNVLLSNLEKVHTTELGIDRIRKNICLDDIDVVKWCKDVVQCGSCIIKRQGKNWYVENDYCIITINAYSYTIITAHKKKN